MASTIGAPGTRAGSTIPITIARKKLKCLRRTTLETTDVGTIGASGLVIDVKTWPYKSSSHRESRRARAGSSTRHCSAIGIRYLAILSSTTVSAGAAATHNNKRQYNDRSNHDTNSHTSSSQGTAIQSRLHLRTEGLISREILPRSPNYTKPEKLSRVFFLNPNYSTEYTRVYCSLAVTCENAGSSRTDIIKPHGTRRGCLSWYAQNRKQLIPGIASPSNVSLSFSRKLITWRQSAKQRNRFARRLSTESKSAVRPF